MTVQKPLKADVERTLARFEKNRRVGAGVERTIYLAVALLIAIRIVVPVSIFTFWTIVAILVTLVFAIFAANYVGGVEKKIANLKHTGLVWSAGWCCVQNDKDLLKLGYHDVSLIRACGTVASSVLAPFLLLDFRLLENGMNSPFVVLAGLVLTLFAARFFRVWRRGSYLVVDSKLAIRSRLGRVIARTESQNVSRGENRYWTGQHVVVLKDLETDVVLFLGPPQAVEAVHTIIASKTK